MFTPVWVVNRGPASTMTTVAPGTASRISRTNVDPAGPLPTIRTSTPRPDSDIAHVLSSSTAMAIRQPGTRTDHHSHPFPRRRDPQFVTEAQVNPLIGLENQWRYAWARVWSDERRRATEMNKLIAGGLFT